MIGRERLVAINFGPDRDGNAPRPPADLLAAIVAHDPSATMTEETGAHWRTGAPQQRLIITFDAGQLRNTHAHGIGCARGYVCHIEHEVRT